MATKAKGNSRRNLKIMQENNRQVKKRTKSYIRIIKYLVVVAAAVALFIGGIAYFNIYLPHGNGPAGPDVPAEPFKNVWSEKKILLLGIGDSITAGFGARNGFSYFDRLIKNPSGDSPDMTGKNLTVVFQNLTAKNIAESGSISPEHYAVISSLEKQPADVFGIIVMTTGGNDLIHNYGQEPPKECAMYGATFQQAEPWIYNFEQRLYEMASLLREKFPGGCQIFLANIYDPTDDTGDTSPRLTGLPAWPDGERILRAYNRRLADCAEKYEYVHLVDIHKLFLGHGIHCRKFWIKNYQSNDPTYWFYLNIEDPSERGYDAIRRVFLLEMIKVFTDTSKPSVFETNGH
jgi:lysophospholipase L1-like esterase